MKAHNFESSLEFLQRYAASIKAQDLDSPLASIRRYTIAGIVVVLILTCGVGVWATTTEISGALIAPGTIVVELNIKKVQHPTGGVVGELLVRDGDRVKAGDLLVRLDDTVTKANLAIVTKTLTEPMLERRDFRPNGMDRNPSSFPMISPGKPMCQKSHRY